MTLRRFVFDTNIYRYTASHPSYARWVWENYHPVSASAVVFSELWRSARHVKPQEWIKAWEKRSKQFIFAPSCEDWRQVGQYLSTHFPSDARRATPQLLNILRKEQNDALIALSSWNRGFAVVTCDNDFERIHTWARVPNWKLVKIPAPATLH